MEGLPKRLDRVSQALALLCTEPPPQHLVQQWLDWDQTSEVPGITDLQAWAAQHARLDWFMGITVIDAALALADEPDETLLTQIEADAEAEQGHRLPVGWWKH